MVSRREFLEAIAATPAIASLDPIRRQYAIDVAGRKYDELLKQKAELVMQLQTVQLELERRVVLSSLRKFAEHFWPVIEQEPDRKMLWNWHLDEIAEDIKRSAEGTNGYYDIIWNVPPGTMKSLLASVFARGWLWARNPAHRFLAGSYSAHLSVRDNLKLRDIVQHAEYQRLFPKVVLVDDQNAKVKFSTTAGGWSIATSVGGAATGEHPDFIIIDDPITEAQSRSDAERTEANAWIDRTLSTRGVSRGRRTWLVMQRLHELDPSGHLIAKGGWRHRVFPMKYIPHRKATLEHKAHTPDPGDIRTVEGELLMPQLYNADMVKKMEIALGPFAAAGQLQQQPVPEGGGLFKRHWFPVVDVGPGLGAVRRVRGWDTASTEDGGDYTSGVRISEDADGVYYVEDVVEEQLSPAGVDKVIKTTSMLDGKDVPIREEKEPGSAGAAVIGARLKMLAGFDYAGVPISGDKVTRIKPFRAQAEGGNVRLVRGAWNERYLAQLADFPVGANDDMVDATSCSFNALLLEPPKIIETAVW